VLDLFADAPVKANESSTDRVVIYTMEMHMHSCDEVIAIYQRVAQVPGAISLQFGMRPRMAKPFTRRDARGTHAISPSGQPERRYANKKARETCHTKTLDNMIVSIKSDQLSND
jgi:hypothetical protein